MKKILSFMMMLMLLVVGLTPGVYAMEDNEVYSNEIIDTAQLIDQEEVMETSGEDLSKISLEEINTTLSETLEMETPALNRRQAQIQGIWQFNNPFGIVNGNLSDVADFYIVENPSDTIAFLKLTAEDPNLIALLYFVNSDYTLGGSTGFGVYANDDYVVTGLPSGIYAIVIGSVDGTARGNYQLHWNRSNPFPESNDQYLPISISEDLMQITIYYRDDKILSNGNNLMTNLEYEARRDFYVPNGYAHITSRIYAVYETGDIYAGAFSYEDFTPYSTDNALIIELKRAGYSYINRFYQNINGNVTSWMYWEDPITGLTTPRTLGDAPEDAEYGPHYLVIDLNTNQVVDFVSLFNYYYGSYGRKASYSNLRKVN